MRTEANMPILPYLETLPEVARDVSLDDEAYVIGKVRIGPGARIGPRSVIRGRACLKTFFDS